MIECSPDEKEEALKAVMALMGGIIASLVAEQGDPVLIDVEGVALELDPGDDGDDVVLKCAQVAATAFAGRPGGAGGVPAGVVLQ